MTLTVFLAICILGCDLLIYFLYEWAFGQSKRIRKHRAAARLWAGSEQARQLSPSGENGQDGVRVIAFDPKRRRPAATRGRPNVHAERLAYQRLAASHLQLKSRS